MDERRDDYATELLRMAVELSPAGILAVDGSGRLVLVNREIERLFGYTREELIGQPIELLVPERFAAAHPGYRAAYAQDAKARPMGTGRDLYGRRKDGSEVPVEIGLNPVHSESGAVVMASVVDISARRRVEDQLRQSQKMEAIGTLAGGIAHDFNNILLAIVGYTELAQQAQVDDQQAADLEQVLQAAERGRQLVQRILAFSRGQRMSRSRVDIARIVRETLQLLRASLPKTIAIDEHVEPDVPGLFADETQLQQVLMNLVTNAAHAMPGGGTLRVSVDLVQVDPRSAPARHGLSPGAHVRVSVIDSGMGMSEEVRARVFEPFFSTKASGAGTGLGLSVTHGIVQSHGGAIEIESSPGAGTRVDVYLPAADGEPRDAEPPEAKGPHVMLVDDEPVLATMMRRKLESSGYRVSMYTSSIEALHAFKHAPEAYDLLVTDNTMPHLTGLALTREIVALRPSFPVLLISGIVDTVDPSDLYETGVTKWLPKPHTFRDLETAVEELVGKPQSVPPPST